MSIEISVHSAPVAQDRCANNVNARNGFRPRAKLAVRELASLFEEEAEQLACRIGADSAQLTGSACDFIGGYVLAPCHCERHSTS
jgi:hypothetical protein